MNVLWWNKHGHKDVSQFCYKSSHGHPEFDCKLNNDLDSYATGLLMKLKSLIKIIINAGDIV